MRTLLKPLSALLPWRGRDPHASELYGAIVAQARLPVFYQRLGVQQQFGVPDTLEGRFVVLSVHLFAVLHRLKEEGGEAARTAQSLANLFAADMETVLRIAGSSPARESSQISASCGHCGDPHSGGLG